MKNKRTKLAAIALAASLIFSIPLGAAAQESAAAPPPAPAAPAQASQVPQPAEGGVNWGGAGWGAATVLADVVYVPVKVLYALLGGIVGAGSWALTGGNTQVANTVWRSSLGGDYVLTPAKLRGDEPIAFSGPTGTAPESQAPAAAPSAVAGTSGPVPLPPTTAYPASSPAPGASSPMESGTGPVPPMRTIE
jgi:hypothetical protein